MAKSTFSAFKTDDGFKFSSNFLAESSSSGRKIHVTSKKHTVGSWAHLKVRPRSHEAAETIWRLVNAVIEVQCCIKVHLRY